MRSTKGHSQQRHGIVIVLSSILLFASLVGDGHAQGATENTETENVPSDAEKRELGSNEDPQAADQVRREVQRTKEEKPDIGSTPERITGFDVYGSIRVRYRDQGTQTDWQDSDSRIGADIDWQFWPKSYLYARYEAGFNVLTGINKLTHPGENTGEEFKDSIFTRLYYVGIDAPVVSAVVGKNWSTYYKVGHFTDRYMGVGGNASGIFNAQTDGGPTGTGRADRTIQSQLSLDLMPKKWFKPFKLNVQVQHGNSIPFGGSANYGTAVGLSAVMTMQNNFTLGVAYNRAEIDFSVDPSLRNIGLSGDARAALVGMRAFGDRWYAGFVLSRLENHETTDDGIYFEGWGSEFYGEYHLYNRIWLVGGYNVLEPDSDQIQAQDYRIKYAVAGLRYTFDKFRHMIFANIRFDDSVNADGTQGSNIYTIGVRWDLSKRGWHVSN